MRGRSKPCMPKSCGRTGERVEREANGMLGALRATVRARILRTRLGGRPLGELLYPAFVRLYPLLFCMRSFEFEGRRYRYLFHPYGATIRGERIVEVPIALEALRAHAGQRVLEVGNVLGHYVEGTHDVVDKYELAPRCINEDILEFRPAGRYDFIISVSTVEHIGWHEEERDPEKAVRALHHMRNLLAPGGNMLVTMPWGQNPALDRYLQGRDCLFDRLRYMKRVSGRNTWVQTTAQALPVARYGHPYPFANVLVLGSLTVPGAGREAC